MSFNKRETELLKVVKFLISKFGINANKYLDLGCGDGKVTIKVSKLLGAEEIYGVDIDIECLLIASKNRVKTFKTCLNTDKLPFKDGSFDFVSSFDVIQYLTNTDNLISESYRVLKPGGYFMITTVNLASWVNRLLLLFGYLPYFYETSFLVDVERRPFQRGYKVGGIVRLYTFKTLENHLTHYGFNIVQSTTFPTLYTSKTFLMKSVDKILSKRKTLGGNIALLAKK
jgi:ubiquinone/menaquinone biosynthesis C-methylase UbiE